MSSEMDAVSSSSSSKRSLSEIAALIDQLKEDDAARRVEATRQLCLIASALGPRRVREELVPFLCESSEESGDEVLMAMVLELGKLTKYVGGPSHAHCLLEPVEALSTVEDSSVRAKAVEAGLAVVAEMSAESVAEHLVPMLRRLSTHDWFTGRMSACGLFARALAERGLPRPARRELGSLYSRLCRDDTPMVRRIAASTLAAVAKADIDLDGGEEQQRDQQQHSSSQQREERRPPDGDDVAEEARERYLSLLRSLADDDQDSVRLQTVENCVGLASRPGEASFRDDVLPVALAACADRSWRVRWSAATGFGRIAEVFGSERSHPAFIELLNDVEPEVRTAAALALPDIGSTDPLPAVRLAAEDASPQVRAALASRIGDLLAAQCLPLLSLDDDDDDDGGGGDDDNNNNNDDESSRRRRRRRDRRPPPATTETQQQQQQQSGDDGDPTQQLESRRRRQQQQEGSRDRFLPVLLSLLRDSNSQVRLNAISNLARVRDMVGSDFFAKSLVPAIVDLSRDAKWRVRAAVISHVPLVAARLDGAHDDDDDEEDLVTAGCVDWLSDSVAAVRELATANLKQLATLFGPAWTSKLLPRLVAMCAHTSYLRRVTGVKAVAVLADRVSLDDAVTAILPALLAAAEDRVPNVRFNAAKALEALAAAILAGGGATTTKKAAGAAPSNTRPGVPPPHAGRSTNRENNNPPAPRGGAAAPEDDVLDDDDDASLGSAAMRDEDPAAAAAAHAPPTAQDAVSLPMDTTEDPGALLALVQHRLVPTLERLANGDPDADVRDFAATARDTIAHFE